MDIESSNADILIFYRMKDEHDHATVGIGRWRRPFQYEGAFEPVGGMDRPRCQLAWFPYALGITLTVAEDNYADCVHKIWRW